MEQAESAFNIDKAGVGNEAEDYSQYPSSGLRRHLLSLLFCKPSPFEYYKSSSTGAEAEPGGGTVAPIGVLGAAGPLPVDTEPLATGLSDHEASSSRLVLITVSNRLCGGANATSPPALTCRQL